MVIFNLNLSKEIVFIKERKKMKGRVERRKEGKKEGRKEVLQLKLSVLYHIAVPSAWFLFESPGNFALLIPRLFFVC